MGRQDVGDEVRTHVEEEFKGHEGTDGDPFVPAVVIGEEQNHERCGAHPESNGLYGGEAFLLVDEDKAEDEAGEDDATDPKCDLN